MDSLLTEKDTYVVQHYVDDPYLWNGNKFDIRLFGLVTSFHPLKVYIHRTGYGRLAGMPYNKELDSLSRLSKFSFPLLREFHRKK